MKVVRPPLFSFTMGLALLQQVSFKLQHAYYLGGGENFLKFCVVNPL